MKRWLTGLVPLLAVIALATWAGADEVKSGPSVGQRIGAFGVQNVTGQQAEGFGNDKRPELCYK